MIKRLLTIALTSLLLVGCTTNKSSDNTSQESKTEVQETVSSTTETSTSTTKTTSSSASDSIIIDKTGDWERSETLASIIDFDKLIEEDGEVYKVPTAVKDVVGKYKRIIEVDNDTIWITNTIIYSDGRYEVLTTAYSKDSKSNSIYLDENNKMQYSSAVTVEYNGENYYPAEISKLGTAYSSIVAYTQGLVVERFGELYWLPLFSAESEDKFFISSDGQANYSRALKTSLEDKLKDFSLGTKYARNLADSDVGGAVSLDDNERVNEFEPAVEKFLTNYDEEKDSEESNLLNRLFQYSFSRKDYQDREIAIEPLTEELSKAVYDNTGKPVDIKRGYLLKVDGDYKEGVVLMADGWTRFNYDGSDKIILK